MPYRLSINGDIHVVEADDDTLLLWDCATYSA